MRSCWEREKDKTQRKNLRIGTVFYTYKCVKKMHESENNKDSF